MLFRDRAHAGRELAARIVPRALHDPLVLALPRGGAPVAFEVASALGCPLEFFVARKIGAPGQSELGIGAVAEGEGLSIDRGSVEALGIEESTLARITAAERRELARRVAMYRPNRPLPEIAGRNVVLVDDGLATGGTATAALRALRAKDPRRLVFAAPVCASESLARLALLADDVVCLYAPHPFGSVGQWFDDFSPTSDAEVLELRERSLSRVDQ